MMILAAEVILTTASILSFILPPTPNTLLPAPEIIVPVINTTTALLCIPLFFKEIKFIEYLILGIQCFSTIISGYEIIGDFLFLALSTLLFIDHQFKNHHILKFGLLSLSWLTAQLLLLPFGIHRFVLNVSSYFFFIAFTFYVYKRLETQLKIFAPTKIIETSVELPEAGNKLILKDYKLTERQIQFIEEIIVNKKTYGELAIKYNISASTVKKDMQRVFDKFAVKNLNNLTLLLLQYDVEY